MQRSLCVMAAAITITISSGLALGPAIAADAAPGRHDKGQIGAHSIESYTQFRRGGFRRGHGGFRRGYGSRTFYGRPQYGRRYGRRGFGYGGALVGGLAAGALIGGTLAAQAQPQPVQAVPTADATEYCMNRFKSYDPSSGTYLGYDGQRHSCP